MVTLPIKPLSVNAAYRGRRFSTVEHKQFRNDVLRLLPLRKPIPWKKIAVKYIFGISNRGGDGDNLIKSFQDCLAEKYWFNDNRIYRWEIEKKIVKKGLEYIEFEITKV